MQNHYVASKAYAIYFQFGKKQVNIKLNIHAYYYFE